MTTAADVIKLMMKYSGQSDYRNSSTGFYGGLRGVFGQLAKEEEIACKWENTDPVEYPDFGQKDDDYEEVVRPFYAAWNGFSTRKSYSWKTYYRPTDAPDRRIRRLMEKENKALRDEAIREFNDAVRSLIAFVRKRDPRYQGNQKSEEERQKILRDAAAAQSARSRAARQAKLDELDRQTVPEWAKTTSTDDHEGGFSSDEDSERQEIECVVCNKTFKSEAQYEAHEKSKKHLKLLKQLQQEMRDQDHELADSGGGVATSTVRYQADSDLGEEDAVVESGVAPVRNDNGAQQGPDRTGLDRSETLANGDDDFDRDSDSAAEKSSQEEDDDYAPRSKVEDRLTRAEAEGLATQLDATAIEGIGADSDNGGSSMPKLGKAKQKRAKKVAQTEATATETTSSGVKCAVCQAEFPSKTKLFNHIKEKGHAAPVMNTAGAKGGKPKKGKKR